MIHEPAVTIAQIRVPDGTNEITQVKNLLNLVTVEEGGEKRVIITLDTAHTQHETARYIAGERGFDYIMTVKGNHCAARRLVVYPTQLGGIVERSLGPMAHLEPKGKGNSSLPGNRRLGPGVWDDAPGDPCDMAKARLPEPQSSADALYIHRKDACNRCPSCVVRVGSATHSSRRGAMPSEGI
jgi:hypothetical protein